VEGWVAHPFGVALEILRFVGDGLGEFRVGRLRFARDLPHSFDLALIESVETPGKPSFVGRAVIRKQLGGEFPEMLAVTDHQKTSFFEHGSAERR